MPQVVVAVSITFLTWIFVIVLKPGRSYFDCRYQGNKVMKIRTVILYLLIALPFVAVGSNLTQSDDKDLKKSETSEQESAESDDNGGDRGFDPCLLNASLAICNKQ
jgi:hypothetical protein